MNFFITVSLGSCLDKQLVETTFLGGPPDGAGSDCAEPIVGVPSAVRLT